MPMIKEPAAVKTLCFHCGEDCEEASIFLQEKPFCCQGCKMVYEILNTNDLCQYYQLEDQAGISLKGKTQQEYAYLEDATIAEKLLDYQDEKTSKITFLLPQIHCASCIWLLENLYRLQDGILQSKVNFLKKEIYLTFSTTATNVRQIVELLASIGYAPEINLQSIEKNKTQIIDRQLSYQLGLAGFAFGNIMLMSFPEYLGLEASDRWFQRIFGYLNILLALPVLFYSGRSYLQSAWLSLRQQHLNIDVPIALGMLTLFGRSVFEIISQTGAGYLDSMAGLVFFLLIGKWFQQKTYHQLSFERDYKSYFPLATTIFKEGKEQSIAVQQLKIGDFIHVKHGELIPADGILVDGKARIDYSFVTGEAVPVERNIGDKVYAGGRQIGEGLKINLTKKVAHSYLTQLWNNDAFEKPIASDASELAHKVGQYFTTAILTIAFATLIYWLPKDIPTAINAFTAVLIIACPCAVALSIPFTFGNVLRLFARQGFYLKNTNVIETLSKINAVVLDKTGTLTTNISNQIQYQGELISSLEKQLIKTLTSQSTHPLSRMISVYLSEELGTNTVLDYSLENFEERTGQGLIGHFIKKRSSSILLETNTPNATPAGCSNADSLSVRIRLGSADFIFKNETKNKHKNINVWLEINGRIKGGFIIQHHYREGLADTLASFRQAGTVHLLSGDNPKEAQILSPYFEKNKLHFNQSPTDKLSFIQQLQPKHKVLMIGDGLNDAGALRQSDLGIVITENTNNFTPACDAILDARQFAQLPQFIKFSQQSIRLVYVSYVLAFIYNIIGLSFAVQGLLSPIVAAILMPLSSVTIVLFGVLGSHVLWKMSKT